MKVTADDLSNLERLNPEVLKRYRQRFKFIMHKAEVAKQIRDVGIVDPERCWDTLAPVEFARERVWENGIAYIRGITPAARAQLPKLKENIWSFVEGGRAYVTSSEVPEGVIKDRIVSEGVLHYGFFQGEAGTPLVISDCTFSKCVFFKCTFRFVNFVGCDFLESRFLGCTFDNCTIDNCNFDQTKWGIDEQPDINFIDNHTLVGKISYQKSKGVGLALFMPHNVINFMKKRINEGDYSQWTGEQLKAALADQLIKED